jgi:sugar lactone lactonase YvrE
MRNREHSESPATTGSCLARIFHLIHDTQIHRTMNNLPRLSRQFSFAPGGRFRRNGFRGVLLALLLPVAAAFAATGPSFTTQPMSQTVTPGSLVKFTVVTTGSGTVTYQWQVSYNNMPAVDIVGATLDTLTISPVAPSNAGVYTVIAHDANGNTTSDPANLIVVTPVFVTQPASQTVPVGYSVTFTVTISDSGAPTFQWQKDGVDIPGATSISYTNNSVALTDAGNYTVNVTNAAGTSTSDPATLTVTATAQAPVFTTQPASQSIPVGTLVILSGEASGSPAPTFQWQKNGTDIAGATGSFFSLGIVGATDGGNYTLVATNAAGFATSSVATVVIIPGTAASNAATITTSPVSQTVTVGASVKFTAAASGNPAPTFQWVKDSIPIPGATGTSYAIASVTAADAGNYSVVATNSGGVYNSAPATLTVLTTDLASETVTTGHNVSFFAANTPGSVQWQVSSDGGTTWTSLTNNSTYSGVTSTRLAITGATSALNGLNYRYVATDGGVVTTSAAVSLTVAQALLPFPICITTDNSGKLYVGDGKSDTIEVVNAIGQVSVLAGTSGTAGATDGTGSAARFNQPGGLALLASGALIVADTANATLRSINTSTGAVTTLAGAAGTRGNADGTGTAATFSAPMGMAVDASGTLSVADAMNDTIRQVTAAGVVTTFAGSAGVTGFADGTGTAARFNFPTGAVFDPSGNLFVSDTTNNTIRKITPAGVVTTFAGVENVAGMDDGKGSGALFDHPGGLAADGAGNLYLADTGNSTIRRISPDGVVSTIAGLPTIAGLEDGTGNNALFNHPQALTLDASGNLYVADTGNGSIRKIDNSGIVTTITLSPASTGVTTPVTPPVTTPVTPPASGSGGGGGAPSLWFYPALLLLGLGRRFFRANR